MDVWYTCGEEGVKSGPPLRSGWALCYNAELFKYLKAFTI